MIQSVDRAVRILTALQAARRMSLSDLADRLDLPPSTVHGIVKTLLVHDMVVQDPESSRYQLGPAVLRLGNVYLDTLDLRSRAYGWAEELRRLTGFAIRVGVPLAEDVMIIHHEPRPDGSRQMLEVGIVIPAHASALGKATLAFAPDQVGTLIDSSPLRSMTGKTVVDPAEFGEQLSEIRTSGIAYEHDEAVLGESSVAGTVFDSTGYPAGAVAIVIPTTEWPADESAVDAVRTAARSISRELGADRWPVT